MDDAHRPRIDPHRGGARKGMDHFFLASSTDPSHAKAILNCLDFQSGAVFSAMVVKGGEYQRPAGDGEGGARPTREAKVISAYQEMVGRWDKDMKPMQQVIEVESETDDQSPSEEV